MLANNHQPRLRLSPSSRRYVRADARTAVWPYQQEYSTSAIPRIDLAENNDFCWLGGLIQGTVSSRSRYRSSAQSVDIGMIVTIGSHATVLIYGLFVHDVSYGVSIRRNNGTVNLADLWITGSQDSCISGLNAGEVHIVDSLFEDCHAFLTIDNTRLPTAQHGRWIITNSLISSSIKSNNNILTTATQPPQHAAVVLENNTFLATSPEDVTSMRLFGIDVANIVDCKNNTIVWPFKEAWPVIPKPCFTFITRQKNWNDLRDAWHKVHSELSSGARNAPTEFVAIDNIGKLPSGQVSETEAETHLSYREEKPSIANPAASVPSDRNQLGTESNRRNFWWSDGTDWVP